MEKTKIIIIGSGWRVECYLRILRLLKENFEVTAVITTNPEKIQAYESLGYSCHAELDDALAMGKPDFILLCINMRYQSAKLQDLLALSLPILVETPVGASQEELDLINQNELAQKLVQVAEQYAFRPLQQGHLALIKAGVIGTPETVEISLTNNYHAFSLMKAYLNNPGEIKMVQGHRFSAASRSGFNRYDDTGGQVAVFEERTIGLITFKRGNGIYDFEGNQHRSYVRFPKLSIRGNAGEIQNQSVKYLSAGIPALGEILRIERGTYENMEGTGLKGLMFNGEWIYQNPFPNLPFSDDDIATAELLMKMKEFCLTGKSFYSVGEAVEDMHFTLLLEKAISLKTPQYV